MVFKITKSDRVGPDAISGSLMAMAVDQASQIASFAEAEPWEGNLSTGLFRLGPVARAAFGLSGEELGLLALIRSFDSGNHMRLLAIFEGAAREPSRFCFASSIARGAHAGRTVFCVGCSTAVAGKSHDRHGESAGEAGGVRSGAISGLFIFPRV